MSKNPFLSQPLADIVANCLAESRQRAKRAFSACFELFRRAVDDKDDAAWVALDAQYKRLMCAWVHKARSQTYSPEEANDIAAEALARFWRSLTRRDIRVADKFDHIGGLIRYLNQCTLSTIYEVENRENREERVQKEVTPSAADEQARGFETVLFNDVDRQSKLTRVLNWIDADVTDEAEKQLLTLTFVDGLSPNNIAKQYPNLFADAKEVRRIKERVLKRARRAFATPIDADL